MKRTSVTIVAALLLALLPASVYSQVSSITTGTTAGDIRNTDTIGSNPAYTPEASHPLDLSKTKFILVTSHNEPCTECRYAYAVICSPGTDNCGIPYKTVYGYEPFETTEKALDFLRRNKAMTFIKLFSVTGVQVEVTEEVKVIKYPDGFETIKIYKIK